MYKGDSRYEKRIDWNQSSEMPDRRCGRHWIELFQRKMLWKGLWQKKCIFGDSWIMKDWCVKKIVTFENRNMEE